MFLSLFNAVNEQLKEPSAPVPMTSLSVEFDTVHAVFQPGQEVSGVAHVQLEKELKAKSVKVIIDGRATTKWEVAEKSTDSHGRSQLVPYSSNVEYVHEEEICWRNEGDKKNLHVGSHSFNFSFLLPETCPPSFEGLHGSVRYSITLVIERPWKANKTFNQPFTVVPEYDLNRMPIAMEEQDVSKTKSIGLVFFRYGRVTLRARLPRSGFVAGERVRVIVDVINESSRPVLNIEASVVEVADYVAYRYGAESTLFHGNLDEQQTLRDNNRRTDERKVFRVYKDFVVPAHQQQSTYLEVCVPPCVPSFDNCVVIHVRHLLEVKIFAKGTINTTARCLCPLIIGTIPVAAAGQLSRLTAALSHRELDGCERIADLEPTYEPCTYVTGVSVDPQHFQPKYPFRPCLMLDQMKDLDLNATYSSNNTSARSSLND